MVDDAWVACAKRSYCHFVDRGAMHRVTGKTAVGVVDEKEKSFQKSKRGIC